MSKLAKDSLIVVTGGAGFIGTNLVKALNKKGYTNLYVVDHINSSYKKRNLSQEIYTKYFDKDVFREKLHKKKLPEIAAIVHLGACSDTGEQDWKYLLDNNVEYSKEIFQYSLNNNCQLIYASSAAVYGDGKKGYRENSTNLHPLNLYGKSKYLFDKWTYAQKDKPKQLVGLRFFNVFGPHEEHKGKMASVVYHGFNQIQQDGYIKLFKSYKKSYADGKQERDFIYVEDVVRVILFFLQNYTKNGIFNVGTGKARTFLDLAQATFSAVRKKPKITFIDMPSNLKNKYQYHTQASMEKLRQIGYKHRFTQLETGVKKYVQNYLLKESLT